MHIIADYGVGKEGKSVSLILDGLIDIDGYLPIGGWWLCDFLTDDHSLILHCDYDRYYYKFWVMLGKLKVFFQGERPPTTKAECIFCNNSFSND